MSCYYCGDTEKEMRPYAPGGADTCFDCAMETPEREAIAKGAFGALLDTAAAVSDVIVLGGEKGPVPFVEAMEE